EVACSAIGLVAHAGERRAHFVRDVAAFGSGIRAGDDQPVTVDEHRDLVPAQHVGEQRAGIAHAASPTPAWMATKPMSIKRLSVLAISNAGRLSASAMPCTSRASFTSASTSHSCGARSSLVPG